MKYWIISVLLFYSSISAQAAEFQWIDHKGITHQLSEMKGKPLLLHLWASWCPPCQAELPEFADWMNKHPEIKSIPISLDSNIENASAFITVKNITMPSLLSDAIQAGKLGVRGLPTTLIIATDGSISQRYLGPRNWNDPSFSQQIEKQLQP